MWEDEIQTWTKNCDASESLPSNKENQSGMMTQNITFKCLRSKTYGNFFEKNTHPNDQRSWSCWMLKAVSEFLYYCFVLALPFQKIPTPILRIMQCGLSICPHHHNFLLLLVLHQCIRIGNDTVSEFSHFNQ